MSNICMITARGGSKRIPKKNIVDFHGKPLIAYSIENALDSGIFDEVIVSSDDEEILNIALKFKAKIFKRDKYADDISSSTKAAIYTLKFLLQNGKNVKNLCLLYPTAPLINAKILKEAYDKFIKDKSLFLFAATEFEYPIQRSFKLDENSKVKMFDEKYYYKRSQDLEKAYHDAGAFYFGTKNAWLEKDFLFKQYSTVYILPRNLVCDIDTKEDLDFAKALFEINLKAKNK